MRNTFWRIISICSSAKQAKKGLGGRKDVPIQKKQDEKYKVDRGRAKAGGVKKKRKIILGRPLGKKEGQYWSKGRQGK